MVSSDASIKASVIFILLFCAVIAEEVVHKGRRSADVHTIRAPMPFSSPWSVFGSSTGPRIISHDGLVRFEVSDMESQSKWVFAIMPSLPTKWI